MSQKKTISLALIVKNEAEVLERCIKSFEGAYDELIVCDTGSTDDSINIVRRLGGRIVISSTWNGFADARQKSFDFCTSDYILWCDADDVLRAGDQHKIRHVVNLDQAEVYFFTRCVRGNFPEREMLIKRGCGKWIRNIHEEFERNPGVRAARAPDIHIIHSPLRYREESHDRNIEALQSNIKQSGMDHFYLAIELQRKGDIDRAKNLANTALLMGLGDVERYELMLLLAICSESRNDKVKYALSSYNLMPFRREALVCLTQLAMQERRDKEALAFGRSFASLPVPNIPIWTLQRKWYGFDGLDLFLATLRRNKLHDEAIGHEHDVRKGQVPTFSLIHATRGRAKKMIECRELWLQRAVDPKMVEHIFSVDGDDSEAIAVASDYPFVISNAGQGCVAAWNNAARVSSGRVLIQLSDDWIPPMHWDKILFQKLGDKIDQEAAVLVSDGIDRGQGQITDCMCLAIMTRARYNYQGHMFYPGYKSVYSDNEFSHRAHQDGIVIDARDVLFEHVHPITGKVEMDKTYEDQNSPERYHTGETIFLSRKNPKTGLDRNYAALILATKDDFCLYEVCMRLYEEGVRSFWFGVPDEYWNGTPNTKENRLEVVSVMEKLPQNCFSDLIDLKLSEYRKPGELIVATERTVRNHFLSILRASGHEHILVVDGDELWKRGTLQMLDRYITDNSPNSLNMLMIPVAGLPGYPIEGAKDGAMVYLGPKAKFGLCRGSEGEQRVFPRRQIYHFTATRKTMEEIIQKHRQSGHYDDPAYDFEGWIKNTLPKINPGMKRAHMYRGYDTWPLVREWTQAELDQMPETIKPFLGSNFHVGDQVHDGTNYKKDHKMKYSQNDEELVILDYFKGKTDGSFLDIGAYTGKELSNTYALANLGWRGVLVEPSPQCFVALMKNYEGNDKCMLVNALIGSGYDLKKFYDSGGGVATSDFKHYEKWAPHQKDYRTIYIPELSVRNLLGAFLPHYDFISIDTEGSDWEILKQFDLTFMKTKMICIEYGKDLEVIRPHLERLNYKLMLQNAENIIYAL